MSQSDDVNQTQPPVPPAMPESRMMLETPAGPLWFNNRAEMDTWKAEPLWRKILGLTAYDRRLKARPR